MNKIKLLTVTVAVILSACTTTNSDIKSKPVATVTTNTPILPAASNPKNVLAMALQTQVRSAFSYQTDVYAMLGDKQNQDVGDQPAEKSTAMSCENTHDLAYIALAKEAKQQGKDITDTAYQDKTHALLQDYKACHNKENQYQPFDFKEFYKQTKQDSPESRAATFLQQSDEHIQSQVAEVSSDKNDRTTQLLEEYLLKPSHVSLAGRYEPYKGVVTALPVLSYQAKNIDAMVNQPIYIDIKKGRIYFWADNLALANSRLLDKSLGDQWQNKWLYFAIDDGSLPKDFIKNLLKTYVKAKAEGFLALPHNVFTKVDETELEKTPFIYENLPQNAQTIIKNTPYIVQTKATTKDSAYSQYVFLDTFYNELTKQYPELTLENALGFDNAQFYERYIKEGESIIHISNLGKEGEQPQQVKEKPLAKMNSKTLIVLLLHRIKNKTDAYLETQAISQVLEDKNTPIGYYGIQNGKISWAYQRVFRDKSTQTKETSATQPMVIDIFTQIHQNKNEWADFSRLPQNQRLPNDENSINILTYKDDLIEKIKNSDDKYLATLLALLGGVSDDETEGVDEADGLEQEDLNP